ncbi:telomere-associated protein Tap [Streptomyces sp. NPDC058232]|uniref:telomere-associated protein Tap n=1 Tax=Streptomyces sp. NPDC058232 TaxID=3346393 RepID=UPI0036E72B85
MEDDHTAELFADVDALLAQVAQPLPPADERERLRKNSGLTRQQIATALRASADLVEAWETGLVEPSGTQRAAYVRLLQGLLTQDRARSKAVSPTAGPRVPDQAPASPTTAPAPAPAPIRAVTPVPAARATSARAESATVAGDDFPAGPLAVLAFTDALTAHLVDGTTRECPAATIVEVLHWALDAGIGHQALAAFGRAADPLIVLTPSANDYLGLPPELEDRAGLRLAADHPWCAAVIADGWKFTHSGFGPWARIYQPAQGRQRRSVQLAVIAWGALSTGGWNPPPDLTAGQLARWLGTYAERVLTPRGSTAVCGQELMTSLRPPTRPVRDGSRWKAGTNSGALWQPIAPAPPEAHDAHPLAQGRHPADAMDEEAWDWHRPLTADEAAYPHVVGLDINLAFVAAAGSLDVGLNTPPEHVIRPRFDKKIPGAWYCDLTHIAHDPRLPSPFTPTGEPPTGPAWYATPTLAYAVELGATIHPAEAYLRRDPGRYLDPWYKRLREAYLATMNDLGVTTDMSQSDFLNAMSTLPQQDPYLLSLLAAIKATGKGGIGKLRAGPRDPHRAPFEAWPALNTPTWRPDIRAAVISRARVNMHRKMLKTADHTGRYPLAVLSDCALYPAQQPTALDAVPHGPDPTGVQGAFRLGASPGFAKEEGVQTMIWYEHLHSEGANPARYIKHTSM